MSAHTRSLQIQSSTNGAEGRLLAAALQVLASQGYAHLTVEAIITAAAVSRASFYQYFSNVEDCFRFAYRLHAEQLVTDIANRAQRGEHRDFTVLDALIDLAISRPAVARVLMTEGLAAGPVGVLERDALISALERAMTGSADRRSTIDLPIPILLGGIFRFLSMRLLDGGDLAGVRDEVREWTAAFERRSSQPSWSVRFAPVLPRHAPRSPAASITTRLRGTPRERILRATAATVRVCAYHDITVADIVATAGVSRRGFYNEFPSKADAFMATYEHGFRQTLAACTPAFFTARAWPERVWQGMQAFTLFLAREPSFAYLGFVECYAVGPRFAARVHDTHLAFTLFLEDGYRQRPESQSLSRSCSALTAATIFELGFQLSRCNPGLYIRRMQPLAVYIALAPFVGLDEAGGFVTAKLSEADAPPPATA